MIDPHATAFPTQMESGQDGGTPVFLGAYCQTGSGLTVRELFAAMAMQGLLHGWSAPPALIHTRAAEHAVAFADALIAELNKPKP